MSFSNNMDMDTADDDNSGGYRGPHRQKRKHSSQMDDDDVDAAAFQEPLKRAELDPEFRSGPLQTAIFVAQPKYRVQTSDGSVMYGLTDVAPAELTQIIERMTVPEMQQALFTLLQRAAVDTRLQFRNHFATKLAEWESDVEEDMHDGIQSAQPAFQVQHYETLVGDLCRTAEGSRSAVAKIAQFLFGNLEMPFSITLKDGRKMMAMRLLLKERVIGIAVECVDKITGASMEASVSDCYDGIIRYAQNYISRDSTGATRARRREMNQAVLAAAARALELDWDIL